MNKKCLLPLIIFSVIFAGCNNIVTTPTRIDAVPSTQLTPTPTSNSANAVPVSLFVQKCIDALYPYSSNNNMSGTLILSSPTLSGNYFLDMDTGTRKVITPNESDLALDFNVSPNRYWIAYIDGGESGATESLIVQSANGQEKFVYPVDRKEWQSIAFWLNNENLALWNHGNPLDSLILFNPFTGDKQVLSNSYPNILPEDSDWDQFWPSITIYDSSLKQVVYLGTNENGYEPGNATLILWNVTKKQQVTKIDKFGYTLVHPIWKMDGSGLALVKSLTGNDPPKRQDELFFLSSDGEIKQLTELSDMYPSPNIYSASLSPDERLLAFEIVTNFSRKVEEPSDRRVLILNMATLEITDYCLTPEQFAHLTWSPDNRFLAFSQPLSGEEIQTVVLDLWKGDAFVIAENLRPAGWLNP
jgi:dipeptidyl aminopeptidase/acylaminoacyl peptidase